MWSFGFVNRDILHRHPLILLCHKKLKPLRQKGFSQEVCVEKSMFFNGLRLL